MNMDDLKRLSEAKMVTKDPNAAVEEKPKTLGEKIRSKIIGTLYKPTTINEEAKPTQNDDDNKK